MLPAIKLDIDNRRHECRPSNFACEIDMRKQNFYLLIPMLVHDHMIIKDTCSSAKVHICISALL